MNRTRTGTALSLAALLTLFASGSVHADVRADQKALVKFEGMLGRMAGLFGGKAAKEGVKTTTAVKGNRKASINEATGQIIDLDEEKVYDLDLKKKTFKVTTFAELRRRMEEARRKAEENARKEQPNQKDTEPAKDPDAKQMEVDFSVKETGEKKAVNGFDTKQVIVTIAIREKGKTLEQSGGLVLTSDIWMAPAIPAMKEIAEFDVKYARQLAGPSIAGVSAEEMAAAMAMYPGMRDAFARLRTEGTKLQGTPILTTTTMESVKSPEMMAEDQKRSEDEAKSSAGSGVSGMLGGFARKTVSKKEEPKARATIMTSTNEVLKVGTDVPAEDVAIPAGFKENK